MKNILIFLSVFLLAACSVDTGSPIITVNQLLLNDNKENYADKTGQIPTLNIGDEVFVYLTLDGNGSDLKSFQVIKDENIDAGLDYEKDKFSADHNFTDPEKGQFRFINGVSNSHIKVNATISHLDDDGGAKISFYLSSKSQSNSAQKVINLKIAKR